MNEWSSACWSYDSWKTRALNVAQRRVLESRDLHKTNGLNDRQTEGQKCTTVAAKETKGMFKRHAYS